MGQTAGQKQEKDQFNRNSQQQQRDIDTRDQQLGQYNTDVAGLTPSINKAQGDVDAMAPRIQQLGTAVDTSQGDVNAFRNTPGYTDKEVGQMKSNAAGQIHGMYGDEMEQIRRNAAVTGNNGALPSQLLKSTQERALSTERGLGNIDADADKTAVEGRRLIPQFQGAVVGQRGAVVNAQGQQAQQQGAVTGQQATQAGLAYQPVQTLTGENESIGGQQGQLIGTMPKTPFWQDLLKAGVAGAGQVGAAFAGKP